MTTYKVEERDGDCYVMGLKEEFGDSPDTMLIYHYTYPYSETPDVDSPGDAHMMFGALYDLLQCHGGLKDGDVFETKFGTFHCEGVHVLPDFELGPDPREVKETD